MIDMAVSVELNGTWAREIYARDSGSEVIKLRVTRDGLNFEYDMTVAETELLIKDLIDWTREVKPYSELHDADEEVLPQAIDTTE